MSSFEMTKFVKHDFAINALTYRNDFGTFGYGKICSSALTLNLNSATEMLGGATIPNKNSSEDEIANVNFLRRYGTYVLQNTKKENLLRLTN